VALLALGGGMLLLTRGQSSPSAATEIKPLHPVKHHLRSVVKKPGAKHLAAAKKKRARTPSVIDGMPAALALALRESPVVVVALYAPSSPVDSATRDEARQGAGMAGAGFVALNIADDKVAAPLTSLLTGAGTAADRVLDDPAVLVFQRPKTLFVRLNGFADRDTVAQAAANAGAVRLTTVGSSAAWASQANAICNRLATDLLRLPLPSSGSTALDWVDKVDGVLENTIQSLRALKPPTGREAEVRHMLALYQQAVSESRTVIAEARAGKSPDLAAFEQQVSTLGARANRIAVDLGATACAGSGAQ
jgi:hypothetical protein